MERLVFIKQHSASHVAHMYEHLLCMEIKRLFYDNGLFKYVDFWVRGTTYGTSGIIEIDLDIYTPKAMKLAQKVGTMSAPTSDKMLGIAYRQLLAEYGHDLIVTDTEKLRQQLSDLNDTPWTSISDFDIIDSKMLRHESRPLYKDISHERKARKLTVKYTLDPEFAKSNRELIPLFRHVVMMIDPSVEDRFFVEHGYYGERTESRYATKSDAVVISPFSVAYGWDEEVDLAKHTKEIQEIVRYLLNKGADTRLLKWLRSASYTSYSYGAPSISSAMSDTGIYVGPLAWKRIATKSNLDAVLNHTTVELKFKRDKRHVALIDKAA